MREHVIRALRRAAAVLSAQARILSEDDIVAVTDSVEKAYRLIKKPTRRDRKDFDRFLTLMDEMMLHVPFAIDVRTGPVARLALEARNLRNTLRERAGLPPLTRKQAPREAPLAVSF